MEPACCFKNFKGGQTWICSSKGIGMCTAQFRGVFSGNHKHAAAACVYSDDEALGELINQQ